MKIFKIILAIGLCLALAGPALAQSAGGQGMGPGQGMGQGMRAGRGMGQMYNPQTVTTIQGSAVGQGPQIGRRMQHVSWVVKTAQGGDVMVHLGPAPYLSQQGLVINPGDTVAVTGSQVQLRGHTAIMAKEVTVNGKTFQVRDDQGVPLWRGQGRRGQQ